MVVLSWGLMVFSVISGFVSWVSWWLCNDIQCIIFFILGMVMFGLGAKIWDEIR